ncbi:MAG: glycoside hydrolase family 108 protein [Pyrinomonadaceae bacterium]
MPDLASKIIDREKGYVHHPKDRGGPTKYGITRQTLSSWLGREATAADVAKLDKTTASNIINAEYAAPFSFIRPGRLKDLLVDAAVQHGPVDAIRWLQRAAGVTPDGRVGPQTIAAVGAQGEDSLYDSVLTDRLAKYAALSQTPRGRAFAKGWENRMAEFLR